MRVSVDILTVFHNSKTLVVPYLESLKTISLPFTLCLLDNASQDDTASVITGKMAEMAFPVHFYRSLSNNGFARGMNLLSQQSVADYLFFLNPDTTLHPGCLETLVARAEADPTIAICEARQAPIEHTKGFDRVSGETSWCSGAAALIRRKAFEEVGRFDERLFFMYCEDVDLSWRLWTRGWRCVYSPGAVVTHFSLPGKVRTKENYFNFRNSLFLYHRFKNDNESGVLRSFLSKRFMSRRYSWRSKVLFAIAFADHIRYIPYLTKTRQEWGGRDHPWIQLSETSLSE